MDQGALSIDRNGEEVVLEQLMQERLGWQVKVMLKGKHAETRMQHPG
jgi:hypothetical protein